MGSIFGTGCAVGATLLLSLSVAPAKAEYVDDALRRQKESVNPYDNCQFHWREISIAPDGTERQLATCEYRSREGKYYRVDRTEVDDEGVTILSRLIVRPEGFVLQQNQAIVAFGSTSEGMQRLQNEPVFEASRRGYYGYTEAAIRACSENPECNLVVHRSENDKVGIAMTYSLTAQQDPVIYHYVYSLRRADGANVKWTETKQTNGEIVESTIVEKQYNSDSIPANVEVTVHNDSESPSFSEKRVSIRTFYDPRPAAIEDFDLAEFPAQTSGWGRRAVLLVTGVIFIAGALILRRRTSQ